jgi:hypothetical protein
MLKKRGILQIDGGVGRQIIAFLVLIQLLMQD